MERIVEQGYLYDFYGELLTGHQQQIYEDFVQNDLSVSEIAKERGISRQGIHDLIKRCDRTLEEYESKLHLVEKFLDTKKQAEAIYQVILESQKIETVKEDSEMQQCLNRIEELTKELLEHL